MKDYQGKIFIAVLKLQEGIIYMGRKKKDACFKHSSLMVKDFCISGKENSGVL